MSDNAVLAAYAAHGYQQRGNDRARLQGCGSNDPRRGAWVYGRIFIEHQLAHAVKDPNGRAYNRTAHLPERRKMMQKWADYLDKLKAGAEIIPVHQKS